MLKDMVDGDHQEDSPNAFIMIPDFPLIRVQERKVQPTLENNPSNRYGGR